MSLDHDIKRRPLQVADLQSIAMLSSVTLSCDGSLMAYVTTKTIIEENVQKDYISVIRIESGEEIKAWEGASPQWSPVANQIAYLAEHEETTYIWIYSLDTDENKPLVPVFESHYFMGHLTLKNFAWSPDGSMIAYISENASSKVEKEDDVQVIDRLLYKTKGGRGRPLITDNELSHISIVAISEGQPELITDTTFNEHSISWSPDSTKIAFISNRSSNSDDNQLHDLWSIDVRTKNVTRHTENFGTAFQPAWSPDGGSIAFLGTRSKVSTNDSPAEDTHLYLVQTDSNSFHCLTAALDRRIEQISWHPAAQLVYFTAGDKGTTAIYNVSIIDNTIKLIAGQDCHILEFVINKAGDTIVYTSTDTTHLTEIFVITLDRSIARQLTRNSSSLLQKCDLQKSVTFWFKSFDGLNIQGWLVEPSDFNPARKYPLVLVIHGGPHNMFGYEFEERMQILSANGYGVLFINPRGSSGYGQAFSNGCVLNWGGGDYKDLMAGVDVAVEANSWIDEDRLGVTGQSYGGYMTNWIITQTNRFKAAVVDGGISNLISFSGTSLYHSLIESEFNGRAYDNFSLLWQWSPLKNVKNVTTPTLLLHGERDNEVPVSQAEEMYIALKKLNVESVFVQYKGEGHGWRPDLKPKNRYDLLNRSVEWFEKYLIK